MRLLRDGSPTFTGEAQSYDASRQSDVKRLVAATRLTLARGLPPGEYILEITVTDLLAKGKDREATQWVDFRIIE